jgi:protein-S-isoprenylcysteine O-methyltransferase Ste14
MMTRALGLLAYAMFNASFVYFIGFSSGVGVARTVDNGAATSPLAALGVDLSLVLFFGVVHSVMARPRFKRAWTRLVPQAAERSIYVLVASLQLALVSWQWRPLGGIVWTSSGAVAALLFALSGLGWVTALVSSCLIDHFELFGLRQAFGRAPSPPVFRTPFLYKWVRHPLYLGILMGLWCAPTMSVSHLLLSSLFTLYILVGVRHEERDLVRLFGEPYRRYQAEVPMLLPLPRRARTGARTGLV